MRTLSRQRSSNQAAGGKMIAMERGKSFRLEVLEYIQRGNQVANQFTSILKLFNVPDESADLQEDSLIKACLQDVKDAREKVMRALERVNLDREDLTRLLLETNERLSSAMQEYEKLIGDRTKNRQIKSKAEQRFDYAKERPKILTCIAETSHDFITLMNLLRHVDFESTSDTVRNNTKVQAYVSQIVDHQADLVNYIQLVENEEMLGTLLETEERATEALLLYEQLSGGDGSMSAIVTRSNTSYEDPEVERNFFFEENGRPNAVAHAGLSNGNQVSSSDVTEPPPYSEIDINPAGGSSGNFETPGDLLTNTSSDFNHRQVFNQDLQNEELLDPFADPV